MRLRTLSNRVKRLEPRRRGRVYLVDGLRGQRARDVLPSNLDAERDLVVYIGDADDTDEREP